jgi:hypothetical protein
MLHFFMAAMLGWQLLGQNPSDQDTYRSWSLPAWVHEALARPAFAGTYQLHFGINPFYQRGDFDGDGATDIAVLVRHRSTGKTGIAFVHRTSKSWHVVGAGSPLDNGGDDFSWLGIWRVEPGARLTEVPGFRAEVLYVEKPESAGALLYWDGKRYRWVQRGD